MPAQKQDDGVQDQQQDQQHDLQQDEDEQVMHFVHVYGEDDPVMIRIMEACDEIEDYLSGLSLAAWGQKCDEFNRIKVNGRVPLDQIISEQFFHDCLGVLVAINRFCPVDFNYKLNYLMNKYGILLVCGVDNRGEYVHDSWVITDMRM